MEWESILAWRMQRQCLTARAPAAQALRVVSRICGLHAQVMSSAEAALAARVDGLRPDYVERALWRDGTLVKTWAMRGTLHLLPAAELPTYVGALSRLKPRHHVGSWLRHHGLTRDGAEAMLAAIPAALADGPLTREELAAAVAERTGDPGLVAKLGGGFGDLLKPAAFRGDLVFAPSKGRNVRFTRPRLAPADGEEAARTVVRAYLAAYGPAPREQFQRWFGMTSPAEAGRWLRALGDEVAEVEQGWMLAADAAECAAAAPAGAVRLLAAFDPYVVAAPRKEDAVLAAAYRDRVYRPQGWLSPVLLVDGRIEGVWERAGDTVALTPFGALGRAVRAAAGEEAERMGAALRIVS